MNINKFAQEVHQNAVDHGFWEGERDITESIALIHSEWSESLEEYRAGHPNVWHKCEAPVEIGCCCENGGGVCGKPVCEYALAKDFRNPKPEGVAVELIDGVIRILDLFGKYGRKCNSATIQELQNRIHASNPGLTKDTPLPTLVCALHSLTARAGDRALALTSRALALASLEVAIGVVFFWTAENGLDPEKLMLEKHEYNKTRPYKHGKKL